MDTFTQIGIIIIACAAIGIITRYLKQPLIISYILVGLIVGPIGFNLIGDNHNYESLGTIGIAFLLFMVGTEINLTKLKKLGSVIISIAVTQILISFSLGYLLASLILKLDPTNSIYTAIALTFASTIVVIKTLSEKKVLDHLYSKIVIGVLLIQDLFAIGALVFLENFHQSNGSSILYIIGLTFFKTIAIILILGIFGHYLINYFIRQSAKYPELLSVVAIAWCFVGAILAHYLGLPIEIGAFIAGVSIASDVYSIEISAKIKPLRDFFLIIFFVFLGLNLPSISLTNENIIKILLLTLFVIIIHPINVIIPMWLWGFKRRTSFFAGISVTQISEFALIIIAMGLKFGYISQETAAIITIVAIITMALSTYLISWAKNMFATLSGPLKLFEKKHLQWETSQKIIDKLSEHVVILGARRTGFNILETLRKIQEKVLVVDFNPEVVEELSKNSIPVIYGDITDPEIIDELNIKEAKMVISTIPEFADNLLTLKRIKKENRHIIFYVTAFDVEEALELYKTGADYVILPHHISGEHITFLLNEAKIDYSHIIKMRLKHIKELKEHFKEHGNSH